MSSLGSFLSLRSRSYWRSASSSSRVPSPMSFFRMSVHAIFVLLWIAVLPVHVSFDAIVDPLPADADAKEDEDAFRSVAPEFERLPVPHVGRHEGGRDESG